MAVWGESFKMSHHDSPSSGPGLDLDLSTLIEAVDAELTSTLVRYADAMPMSLITMGKYALAGPGKVLSPRRNEPGQDPPRWPLFVLLSCQAASPPQQHDAWRQALPAAVAVEIAMGHGTRNGEHLLLALAGDCGWRIRAASTMTLDIESQRRSMVR